MGQVHFLVLSWVLVLISSSRMGLKLRKNLARIRLKFSFSHSFLREKFLYLVNFQKDLHSTIFFVFSISNKYKIKLWKFYFVVSKIRAMRNHASRGMTVWQKIMLLSSLKSCSGRVDRKGLRLVFDPTHPYFLWL